MGAESFFSRLREARRSRADEAAERAVRRLQADESAPASSAPAAGTPQSVGAGRVQVPWAVDVSAAWAWRLIVIAVAILAFLKLLSFFSVIVFPVIVALLITALAHPVVMAMTRWGISRRIAALIVVVVGLGSIALLLTFVGQQIANGISDLSDQVVSGVGQIRDWLRDGPLGLTDNDIQRTLQNLQDNLSSDNGHWLARATEVGATLGHVVAGVFIVLFSTYFFLADGPMIWAWIVRLFPRVARVKTDSSGQVAWRSLTQFVRATVLVAATDAAGIAIGAAVLDVPFVLAIAVLVFLGAFVPMVGATVSGAVAILVALVAQGPVTALIMFGVVIGVQQLEAHVLQPFLMGRFVSVHPLGVILAIGLGVIVAGIAGALIAVPLAAALNAVAQHLASHTDVDEDPEEALEEDLAAESAERPALG